MRLQLCPEWGVTGAIAGIMVVAITALGLPVAATAAPTNVLSVNGQTLGSSILSSGSFTVGIDAPTGVSVKFKLDGTYLGEDRTAPYSWPIVTSIGNHKIDARWDMNGRKEIETAFVVAAPVTTSAPVAVAPPSPAAPAPAIVAPVAGAPVASALAASSPVVSTKTEADAIVLSVNGADIASSVRPTGNFSVSVNAPARAVVKFKIDGSYLGQDRVAPYTWPIVTGVGNHTISARWDGGEVESTFDVGTAAAIDPGATVPTVVNDPIVPVPVALPIPLLPTFVVPVSLSNRIYVATSAQLVVALRSAVAGQTIALADGNYVGQFESAASGTASAPITIVGSRSAVLSTGRVSSGYGLHITGSHWRIYGISVTNSGKGIVLDGSKHTTISSVDVGNIGAEAVHFRTSSSDGVIENSTIHDTGLWQPAYGEGVYIGSANSNWGSIMGSEFVADQSDRVVVRNNRIWNTAAEGVDIKEGTTGGSIVGNAFLNAGYSGQNSADSWVDVKGNGYTVADNTGAGTLLDAFQVHSVLSGWGRDNRFTGNSVFGGVPGYEVWIQSASLGTVVDDKASGAAKGVSNIVRSA